MMLWWVHEVIGDDVVDLFDFIEQAIGQGYEFVGPQEPGLGFLQIRGKNEYQSNLRILRTKSWRKLSATLACGEFLGGRR